MSCNESVKLKNSLTMKFSRVIIRISGKLVQPEPFLDLVLDEEDIEVVHLQL